MLLDTVGNTATFRAMPYDIDAHVAALRHMGLPPGSYRMAPIPATG